jgi:transposase InsO family protein
MPNWACRNQVVLKLIDPGKLNQNAPVESFIWRLRDECLNGHWFTSLAHAREVLLIAGGRRHPLLAVP